MKKLKLFFMLPVLFLCTAATAEAQSFAVKANAGTTGLGLEAAYRLSEPVNLRIGANFLSASYLYETDADDEYDLDASLKLGLITALADWHPFRNSFRLTAGLVYNSNTISGDLLPKKSYTIGGDVYTPEDLGSLSSEFTFNPIAPYLALGFGNAFSGSRFGVNMDLGLIFQGPPKVSLEAEGLLSPSAAQAPILEDNVSWATLYPVLTLSFTYRIN
ncbi:MAG: hypothetical protein LAT75_12180 [Candidatus Cyclonatronum sp.]|uniref:hypothetical protein n=1 Tax=Cyclonatronum sp. TaxID=3024185 RepID=UPI0025C5E6E7|nr:hypothetical protein [Cyclonatronum sp.]MCC5935399.1 hypothetical protein [Balneolales bacterium]MCH8487617.1 hypothetical protein [Cyclonatronum sp.]